MDIYSYHELIIFMRLLFPLIACLFLLLPRSLSYNYLPPLCHQEERVALMQFKDSFIIKNNSDCEYTEWNYPKVASWRMDGNNTNCCVWDGVECNQDTGHVIALNLLSSCLYGSITSNSSLFRLHHLQNLTLAHNDFNHSQIPSEIGNLSSLTHLDLSYSNLSGQIPSEFQYLSKLSFLSLSYGFDLYTKSLTSLVQNLTNLELLDFLGVNISSTVPETLANLSSLKSLILNGCGLYGRFPTRIFQLAHLQELNVAGNEDLAGHLPEFHTNSPLKSLVLRSSNFSGDLPASIGNLNSLSALVIDNCNFSGTIPNSFSNLTQLTWLDLSQNSFNDLSWLTRASSNAILPQFEILGLDHLNLTKFPDILRNQSRLWCLDLSGNNLQGLIPKWIYNVSKESLLYLSLSNNVFLTGFENFPAIIPWPNLKYLLLDNNMMNGSLPIPPPSLQIYVVSTNSFTGRISPFFCNMSSPISLDLSYNHLSGMIHPCFGNLNQTSLLVLALRCNNLGGTIPKTWAKGCLLRMLDLSQNQLQGHLPRSLANCTELEYLHVGHNQINDTYPSWLGTLQQLKILVFHSNGFHGAIWSPETNYSFPNLHIIDLSHNHLSGNLPVGYFAQWDAMESVGSKNLHYQTNWVDYSITMAIKGVELEYKKIHDDLKVIDFSCNRFEGEIPEQVGNLKGLHVLNLSNNAFTGHIPSSFGNLTELESLDLSQNKLFGEIPPELVQLHFLSMFNVSHNGLTGHIPQGQQFGTFENTSFEDNRGLCGRPLSKICGDSNVSPPTFEENQGPRFVFEFGWKVVAMGYGCGFVFGVVIGHIVTTRKPDLVIKIFGKKQRQTRISRVNRRK